jgi:hypothetical protein
MFGALMGVQESGKTNNSVREKWMGVSGALFS